MKQKKTNVKGFTLVELIVVIAIIGVLVGILVPSMLGIVKKAKLAAVNSGAKSVLNAGMTACRETEIIKPITSGIYSTSNSVNEDTASTLKSFMYQYSPELQNKCWAMMIRDDVVTAACYTDNASSNCVGTYPTPNTTNQTYDASKALNFAENGTWA